MDWFEVGQWVLLAYCVWGVGAGLKVPGVIEHLERRLDNQKTRIADLQTRMDDLERLA